MSKAKLLAVSYTLASSKVNCPLSVYLRCLVYYLAIVSQGKSHAQSLVVAKYHPLYTEVVIKELGFPTPGRLRNLHGGGLESFIQKEFDLGAIASGCHLDQNA